MSDPAPTSTDPALVPVEPLLAMDTRTLAQTLSCSPRHIDRLDSSGKLPAPVYIGKAKRWALDGPNGIREWLRLGCPDRLRFKTMQGMGGVP